MINNIKEIKKLLVFENDDHFYHLQIIKRKKENPEVGSNSYMVKTYYINSLEYLDFKYEEIINLCKFHNARAYINLNRRSFERMAYHTLKKITDQILNKDFKSVRKAYESVSGTYSIEPHKKWIIDVDSDLDEDRLRIFLWALLPVGNKTIAKIKTKNGYHLITSPFDLREFRDSKFSDGLEVHKDNPTILFIP